MHPVIRLVITSRSRLLPRRCLVMKEFLRLEKIVIILLNIITIITYASNIFSDNNDSTLLIENILKLFGEKYLKQFSFTFTSHLDSTLKFSSLKKFSPSFLSLCLVVNCSGFSTDQVPSICFAAPSNDMEVWNSFQQGFKICYSEASKKAGMKSSQNILVLLWPQTLQKNSIEIFIEHEMLKNPLWEKVSHLLRADSHVFIIFPENDSDFLAYEVYFIKELLIFEKLNYKGGGELLQTRSRRSNFRRASIVSVTQYDEDFPILTTYTNSSGNLVMTGGVTFELLKFVSSKLNFTIRNILGKGWIGKTSEGVLTGMGEQILSHEADFILSASEVVPYRLEQLGLCNTNEMSRIEAYFEKPAGISSRDIYLTTFQPDLWAAILAFWLSVALILYLFIKIQQKFPSRTDNEKNDGIAWNNFIFSCISSICHQGWEWVSPVSSLRLILLSGTLLSIFIYTIFSSVIISRLAVEKDVLTSLNDLKREGFEFYAHNISLTGMSIVMNITGTLSNENRFISVEEAVEKMRNSKTAFITANSMFFGQRAPNVSLCHFKSRVKVEGGKIWSTMYFRKNDPIRKFFNYKFSMWNERGIHKRTLYYYKQKTQPLCEWKSHYEISFISFFDVVTAFFIFGAGFLASIIFLAIEYLTNFTRAQ